METIPPKGAATGGVRTVLRLEGLLVLGSSVAAYRELGGVWTTFLLLFLTPDLSFAAAFSDRRSATAAYNLAHTYAAPLGFAILAGLTGHRALLPYLAIWTAHIGFDRAVGYGLKYASAFEDTHLGRIGRRRSSSTEVP